MINPAVFALQKRTIMVMLTVLLVGAGIISYQNLGRLEDPGFTIKTALIVTPYPGASPARSRKKSPMSSRSRSSPWTRSRRSTRHPKKASRMCMLTCRTITPLRNSPDMG
ncbi:efflux RND transporter permease subunit [Prosthecochloris sp. HL-130-GSB]|uniref:efflux RND transporter permease subunit n=1 Tax=Prosthecochloris sp. HL-130-GSB TaxID=1974213 RepID=UPI0018DB98DE|nr:efflux RND transporter permease subunit [Prosthecochloris sp. HL-130-GSB]